MITFTQQEKEDFLQKQDYIIDTVIGYDNRQEGQIDFPVKVALEKDNQYNDETFEPMISYLRGKYYANIQTEYGIDTVFEREFKKRLLKIL